MLAENGIAGCALDFDGVLAGHGADQPLPVVVQWLDHLVTAFGQKRICILSNRPVGPRVDWFAQHYPDIRFIHGVPKKPDPTGILQAAEMMGCSPSQLLMVDDRLLTGVLAALLAGAQVVYIREPYQRFDKAFWYECFFSAMRSVERLLVRVL
mgnify:CR=1 FL=1